MLQEATPYKWEQNSKILKEKNIKKATHKIIPNSIWELEPKFTKLMRTST